MQDLVRHLHLAEFQLPQMDQVGEEEADVFIAQQAAAAVVAVLYIFIQTELVVVTVVRAPLAE